MKLPPEVGASREGNGVLIVPLNPAYPASAGRGTCRPRNSTQQQACPVLDTGRDEGNPAKRGTDGRFSAAG